MTRRLTLSLLACTLICGLMPAKLTLTKPENVGMDSHVLYRCDSVINKAVADGNAPGVVLAVVRHGKMAYLKAYGNRRVMPQKEAMTVNTAFDMASCTKVICTATSIMKLIDMGFLRLNDPVSQFIPGFKDWQSEDGKQKVTIRIHHLLTHSSGLAPYASVPYLQKEFGSPNPKALINQIAQGRRDFQPGTKTQYSCLNFITLQNIVENVTGKSLRDFAKENIFKPLSMNNTDYLPCRLDDKGYWVNTPDAGNLNGAPIAPTEVQENGQVLCGQVHDPLARVMNGGISGNAGLFTTADDIATFCAMLQNGGTWNGKRILGPLTAKLLRTVPEDELSLGRTLGWNHGLGYTAGDMLAPETYFHTGYTGTSIVIDPVNDVSVIVLTNSVHPHDGPSAARMRSLVCNIVAAAIVK